MIKAIVVEDTKVLIPNEEHKNFTEGKEVIKKDTEIEGNPKFIQGMRRGEPFTYKLFLTKDKQLIYLKKIKPMNATEVTLGADSAQSSTVVNLNQNFLAKPTILGAIGGAVIGFGYAKYKKHEMKKAGMYALIGAVAGFVIGKVIEHKATVKPSK